MTRHVFILFTALVSLAACSGANSPSPGAQERMSGQERGGGDDTGLEFNQALQQAYAELKTLALPEAASVDFANVDRRLTTISVLVVSEPLQTTKDGAIQESVAVNDSSKNQILVNRTRWHDLAGLGLRKTLALHELLSIVGYESTGHYPISTAYMIKIGVANDPGYLDAAATCVQTFACSMKAPICTLIPRHYDRGDVYARTDLSVYGKISITCTDHAGHTETRERIGGFAYGSYANGIDDGQSACAGRLQEVAYMTPTCP